jgi:hypothetical protein
LLHKPGQETARRVYFFVSLRETGGKREPGASRFLIRNINFRPTLMYREWAIKSKSLSAAIPHINPKTKLF